MMYAILDIETTGGKYNNIGITEIAIYRFNGYKILDEFHSLVNPDRPIQPFVIKLTGINNKMLNKAPKFHNIAKRIIDITSECILIAHNSEFDYGILKTEFKRLGYIFKRKSICTVQLSKKLLPNQESYKLGRLSKALNINLINRHRAKGDALATLKLFKLLIQKDPNKIIINTIVK